MVDLYNVETYNADTGFKVGYLNELERMLEKVLPYAMLKSKPNLESRIRTLKKDWVIVYDMLNGKDNSGLGWDEHRQMVVVEDAHKAATRKYAQTVADIVEEIDVEDVATTNNLEEGNNYHGCEDNVSLNEMDVSATQSQPSKPNQDGKNIQTIGLKLSRSIASEKMLQESAQKLYLALCEVEGLTKDDHYRALRKIPNHPMQMLIFFSLPSSVRLEWVRRFLSDH
ncbi:hypothetical protein Gohar_012699 [Gossypium harknessii]|uniref:Myb/SANT-like domain-containing protein n=1 Tax=Gossypium harknessii TaxID=34285 RepID=A0A7J9GXT3_9ROSI|nr:hypothetical protein [Gossypium harknessii]